MIQGIQERREVLLKAGEHYLQSVRRHHTSQEPRPPEEACQAKAVAAQDHCQNDQAENGQIDGEADPQGVTGSAAETPGPRGQVNPPGDRQAQGQAGQAVEDRLDGNHGRGVPDRDTVLMQCVCLKRLAACAEGGQLGEESSHQHCADGVLGSQLVSDRAAQEPQAPCLKQPLKSDQPQTKEHVRGFDAAERAEVGRAARRPQDKDNGKHAQGQGE